MKWSQKEKAFLVNAAILAVGLLGYWLLFGSRANPDALEPATSFHPTPPLEQWLLYLTAVAIKPAYLLLTLIGIIWLWKRQAPDLAALRRGLVAFWLGENACSVNFLFHHGNSEVWDYFHNFGMVVCFSFIAYALMEGVDRRIIKYSSATDRCAALSLCRACVKYSDVPCGLRRVFMLLIPATIVVALMPLCAQPELIAYDTKILGSVHHFAQTLSGQLFEIRYCPWLAILLLAISWSVLLIKKEPVAVAKIFFAAASGPLGFSMMRLFMSTAFQPDLTWFMAWEEVTELLFAIAVVCVLLIFRRSLLAKATVPASSPDIPGGVTI